MTMIKDRFTLTKEERKTFLYLLVYSLLFILPVILANTYYIDDIGRSMTGNTQWKHNGRPLMLLMAMIFSEGHKILPAFPIPLLLGIPFFDYVLVLLSRKWIGLESHHPLLVAGVLGFAFTNLFILENISYSYESLGMLLALCLMVFPYILCDDFRVWSFKKCLLPSAGLCVLSLCFYQAAVGAYLVLAIMEIFLLLKQGTRLGDGLRHLFYRLVALVVGILFYEVTAGVFLVKGYAARHSGIALPVSIENLHMIMSNFMRLLDMLKEYFITIGPLLCVCMAVIIIAYTVVNLKNCKASDYTAFRKIILTLAPWMAVVASVLPYVFLSNPVFAPRVWLSFSLVTLWLGIMIYDLGSRRHWIYGIGALFLLFNFGFSAAYGNILNREQWHDAQLAQYIVYDLNQLEKEQGKRTHEITFVGSEPPCQELRTWGNRRPLLKELVPLYMDNDWHWGAQYINHFRKEPMEKVEQNGKDVQVLDSGLAVRETEFYKVGIDGDRAIVVFKPDQNYKYHRDF